MRVEFGVKRTECGCASCSLNCCFMPGYLIPSDLDRLIPFGVDPLAWAETQLLASPGALVARQGQRFRIRTLVPAVDAAGACIHLTAKGRCAIWRVSPFGCAFFDCGPDPRVEASCRALMAVADEWGKPDSLYTHIWLHLQARGLVQFSPEVLRERMRVAIEGHL